MNRHWGLPLLAAGVLTIAFQPAQADANWTEPFAVSSGQSDMPRTHTSADGRHVITAWRNTAASNVEVEARASSNGGVTWSSPQVLNGPGQDVDEFAAALSADGKTAVVGWDLDTGMDLVYVTISRDGGLTWSPPTSLGASGTGNNGLQLAVSADGSRVVAGWNQDSRNYVTISDDGGASWLPSAFAVSPAGQSTDRTALAMSENGGVIYVGWVNYTQNPDSVQIARSANGGQTWVVPGAGDRISSNASDGFDRVFLDCSSDGSRVVAMWNTSSNGVAANRSEDGGATWLSAPDITQITASGSPWSLQMSADGSRVVAAVNKSDGANTRPAVRMSSNGGTSWAADTPFISPVGAQAGGQAMQMSPSGQSLVALWSRSTSMGVSRSSDHGSTWTTEATLDANGQNVNGGSLSASSDLTWANASWIQSAGLGSGTWVSRSAHAPSVTGVSPNSGPMAGGTTVTITGTGFVSGAEVTFGAVAATEVVVASTTTITAKTPASSEGKAGITVTNVDGQSATLADSFTFVAKKAQEPTKRVKFTKKVKPGAWVKVLATPVTTNAGQRATVTATATSKGKKVAKKFFKTRTKKGHFQVRSNGKKKLVVTVRLEAPEVGDYLAYSAYRKYTVKKG